MLNINFYSESDLDTELENAIKEYRDIWTNDGVKIVNKLEFLSGLKFRETVINAIVYKGRSHSKPLSLRSSLSLELKKGVLVHELIHRLIAGNNVAQIIAKPFSEEQSLQNHKQLDLILYDVLTDLYNESIANAVVKWESEMPLYKDAWDYALSMTKEERQLAWKNSIKSQT